ncbi:hypothetical protein ACH0BF_19635 [Pseudobacillus sp. 179-B 2D1 NHS]|uniref:hypothetical protein n=1 Tax=Pseudobacillus sp. 179-B 2D1 NHS TaxID=3374292 RepID=UPI0038794624
MIKINEANILLEWECDSCFSKNTVKMINPVINKNLYKSKCQCCFREKNVIINVTVIDSEQVQPFLIEVKYFKGKDKWNVLIKNMFDEIIEEKILGRNTVARTVGHDLHRHYREARLILYKKNGDIFKAFMSFKEYREELDKQKNLSVSNQISKIN